MSKLIFSTLIGPASGPEGGLLKEDSFIPRRVIMKFWRFTGAKDGAMPALRDECSPRPVVVLELYVPSLVPGNKTEASG